VTRPGPPVAAAAAAGLALADGAVVVLALPQILNELDASVQSVAGVIGAYTLALALALPLAVAGVKRAGPARSAGIAILAFAAAGAICGLANEMELLIAMRAVQGAAGAAVLAAAFVLLDAGRPRSGGRTAWVAVAVFGAAAGPALGGVLTQVFEWRAVFLAQVPVLLVAGLICLRDTEQAVPPPAASGESPRRAWALLALGLLSAALTGVLFLLVLLLVSGWALSPLAAAAVVSVLPAAALAGTRIAGDDTVRAVAGSLLVAGGVAALAFLPLDAVAATLIPQLVAGLGMGMSLPALAGGLSSERTVGDAAGLLGARHLGITVALAILATVAAAQLDAAEIEVRERGAAVILDARLPPLDKLGLVQVAAGELDSVAPRAALRDALEDAGEGEEHDALSRSVDDTLVGAIDDAFRPAFLICGAMALLAALALTASAPGRPGRPALAAAAVALILIAGQAVVNSAVRPDPVEITDPCGDRELPGTGGLDGFVQDQALRALDRAACSAGSSREELALALVDADSAERFEREHGSNPRDALGPVGALLELLGG